MQLQCSCILHACGMQHSSSGRAHECCMCSHASGMHPDECPDALWAYVGVCSACMCTCTVACAALSQAMRVCRCTRCVRALVPLRMRASHEVCAPEGGTHVVWCMRMRLHMCMCTTCVHLCIRAWLVRLLLLSCCIPLLLLPCCDRPLWGHPAFGGVIFKKQYN